ncbi:hypothetical protein B0H10DRAFT_50175 [Mycena sp. CBHHK59/15]|nr:hypothetical protein B0H10DRAFT_50175 [Mycena sp. CBHHK59/15]
MDGRAHQVLREPQALGAGSARTPQGRASFGEPIGPTTHAEFVEKLAAQDAKVKRSASGKTPKTAAAKPARIVHLRATASTTIRNLCLKSYIQKNGKVTKEVFDFYFKGLSPEELKEWETPNEAAGTSGNAGRRKLYREY